MSQEMKFTDGTNTANNKQDVVELLNTHFARIGERTTNITFTNANQSNTDCLAFLPPVSDKYIFLSPVCPQELINITQLLKIGTSSGADGSTTNLLKQIIPVMAEVLAHIINLSFKEGTFPQYLKTARIIALHKGGDPTNPSNYRPISILSAISKLLERYIYNRLVKFLMSTGFFTSSRFGFRKEYSTEHTILVMSQSHLF